ncbi:MAG: K(+)-transporting ATPase subunit F [Candidatus Omnitrophica bacterium]|nr:K(+)-transporting ATPase subunit F [Candidatus Omnitrophota bacterium]
MVIIYWIGGVVAVGLFIYLLIAFFKPELF